MTQNELILSNLLNRACEIITSLEGYANEHSHYPEHNKELQKTIDNFFNEVDMWDDEVFDKGVEGYNDIVELERANQADLEAQDYDVFGENKV